MAGGYATPDQVRGVLTRDLTQPAGTAAELDDFALAEHIRSASDTVDVYLAQRYGAPFTNPPGLVVDLTIAIAAFLATLSYRQSVEIGPAEPVALRNTWASNLLTALSKGVADLPGVRVPGDNGAPTAGVATVRNANAGRLFSLDDFSLGYSSYDGRVRGDWHGW